MHSNRKMMPLSPHPAQQRQREGKGEKSNATSKATSGLPSASGSGTSFASIDASDFASGKGGGALRSIDQAFTVNPCNGTMSLSLPLELTKARNKFQPSLSLSYNSGSGNGHFGIGWDLSLESICRKTSKHIPRYDGTDTFVLSGLEDLVPIQDQPLHVDGYSVQRYRPRVEQGTSALRIEHWTSLTDGDDVYWRTISESNVVKIYGRTNQSRVFETTSSGSNHVFSWLLCESYDPFGDAMTFSYKAEDDVGVMATHSWESQRPDSVRRRDRYIKSIRYGNRRPSRDMESWSIIPADQDNDWMFEVVFDYGEHESDTSESNPWRVRADPFSSYAAGFEIRSYRLCRRVLMFHHFEQELGLKDYLVSSYTFEYDESPTGSLLSSTTFSGHIWNTSHGKGSYISQSLAPCTYTYSKRPSLDDIAPQTIKPRAFQTLPVARPNAEMRWIDIHGEGSQGILLQVDGTWYYQRNECAVNDAVDSDEDSWSINDDFGPFRTVDLHPNATTHAGSYFEDVDGNGHKDLVVLDSHGRLHGYFECTEEDKWNLLHEFPASANLNNGDKTLRRIDLTGNGRNDLVFPGQSSGEVVWHESLGKEGFAIQRHCHNSESLPELVNQEPRSATYMADASGDGHTDIVKLSNGRVSYWPNLGYGKFGPEVVMGNCPVFDSDEQFTTQRVRLLDLDGSGTCDVLYLLPEGGAVAYYNLCGNEWSTGIFIEAIPRFDELSDVFTSDLLAKGTSCLCWTGPENGDPSLEHVISYLDLGGLSKPNLLKGWASGTGISTSITYSPSTKQYLQDEKQGRPWKTKLPFPVHTVSRTVEKDEVTGSTRTTKYRYHEGYYDGKERQFRGFGQVDQWEVEEIPLVHGMRKYAKPTRLTKIWYHTGAEELGLAPSGSEVFGKVCLHSMIPNGLCIEDSGDAFRALKGKQLRVEVYGKDLGDKSDIPYKVEEASYDVVMTGSRYTGFDTATFRVQAREKLSLLYERSKSDPRITHDMTVQTNDYGDVTRSIQIAYGRGGSPAVEAQILADQEVHHIKCIETTYTNAVDETHSFRKPMVASTATYYVSQSNKKKVLDLEQAQREWLSTAAGVIHKGEETRTYYRSQDLSKRLSLGELETFSVIDQEFQLAMTRPMYEEAYGKVESAFVGFSTDDLLSQHCAYADLNEDGSAWISSPRQLYGDKDGQLREARMDFFVPRGSKDAFGNISRTQMDEFGLLPVKSVDAIGNFTEARNDYRVLQAREVTDENKNRIQAAYDALGQRTALAKMGKAGTKTGDSLESLDPVSDKEVFAFICKPSREEAFRLLGQASTRWLRCRVRMMRTVEESLQPTFHVSLSRTQHSHDPDHTANEVLVQVVYLDGRGRETQQLSITHWDETDTQWCVTSHKVHDAKGNVITALTPYFSTSSGYEPHAERQQPRTINFLDALDRNVGVLNPNHSWTKTTLTPWTKATFDAGDNILNQNPRSDPDVGYFFSVIDSTLFLPSWHEINASAEDKCLREAASQSASYADKPITAHFDSRGHQVAVIEKGSVSTRMKRFKYDDSGNKVAEIDALGRIAEQSLYDLLRRRMTKNSIDAGTEIHLLDSHGNVVIQRNSGGVQRRTVYDSLLRKIETWIIEDGRTSEILWSKTVYGEGQEEAESKNLGGQIWAVYDQSGVRNYPEYDFKGNRLVTTTQLAVEYKTTLDWSQKVDTHQHAYTIRSTFDALDRVVTSTDATGHVSMRKFDPLHGLRSLHSVPGSSDSPPQCHVSNTIYTADGLVSRVDYGNSTHSVYTYDGYTRYLLNRRTWRDDKSLLEDLSYTYDCLGRIIREKNAAHQIQFFRNLQVSPMRSFVYDDFGRLIKATGRETVQGGGSSGRSLGQVSSGNPLTRGSVRAGGGSQVSEYVESYSYDDADNILAVKHEFSDPAITGWKRTYHYTEKSALDPNKTSNRLSGTELGGLTEKYGYEGNAGRLGCMTSMTGYYHLGWDINNKLRCTSRQKVNEGTPQTTWYIYNEEGERVRKVTDHEMANVEPTARKLKETIFLKSTEVFHTYSSDGQTLRTTTNTSILSGGPTQDQQPVASIENHTPTPGAPTEKLIRYHVSTNLEVDDEGQVVSYEEYSPFGVSVLLACRSEVEAPRRHRFAAYRRDHETGLYACGERYYAPWLCRWTSPDPLGTVDGPNIYAYVGNDPVNWVDPKGTCGTTSKEAIAEKRRLAIAHAEAQLDTATKFSTHVQMIEDHIRSERSLKQKIKGYLIDNKKKIARKAFTVLIAESLGLIPFAGSVAKFGFQKAASVYESNEEVKQRKKEIKNAMELGYHYGQRAEEMKNQKTLADIVARNQDNPTKLIEEVEAIGLHGFGEPPLPYPTPEHNVNEFKAVQEVNKTREPKLGGHLGNAWKVPQNGKVQTAPPH